MKFSVKNETKKQFDSSTGERRPDRIVCWLVDENDDHVAILFENRPKHEFEANLLAAAPEMLEALKRVANSHHVDESLEFELLQLIKKATGDAFIESENEFQERTNGVCRTGDE